LFSFFKSENIRGVSEIIAFLWSSFTSVEWNKGNLSFNSWELCILSNKNVIFICQIVVSILEFKGVFSWSPFDKGVSLFGGFWITLINIEPLEMSVFMHDVLGSISITSTIHIGIGVGCGVQNTSSSSSYPHGKSSVSKEFISWRCVNLDSIEIVPCLLGCWLFPLKPSTKWIFLWELCFYNLSKRLCILISGYLRINHFITL